jgi:hypothetical protein
MDHDTHRCAICQAEFASSDELLRHEKARHTITGIDASAERPADEHASAKPRQGREFDRRNTE